MAPRKSADDRNVDGTQAIRRAAAMLRRIGQGAQGVGMGEIVDALQLPRSTSHRILKCLVDEGLVEHDQENRRYRIGRLTYELGLTVTKDPLEIAQWRSAVDRVAQRTGATAYLMRRSGAEAVCVLKTDGTSVIRVIPVDVGQRRLLGAGAGSTALLAALDEETSERLINSISVSAHGYPQLKEATIRRIVDEARRTGFAVSQSNVVDGAIGIGMAVSRSDGTPYLALSIAALAAQANERLIEEWKQIIRQEIAAVLAAQKRPSV